MLTRCRQVATLLRPTGRRHTSTFTASPTADFERPTPIVLVTPEGYNHDMWLSFRTFASNTGYNGMCLNADLLHTFEASADQLHRQIVAAKLTPPIMVAHSMSTFAAQKYLESYALSGLVLVNPFPPSNARHTLNQWFAQQQAIADTLNQVGKYGWSMVEESALQRNIQSILADVRATPEDDRVNLERGCVPTLIATTDESRHWLAPAQLHELVHLHAVPPEDVHHFIRGRNSSNNQGNSGGERSGIPMVDHPEEFNRTVITWIENVT